MISRIFGATCLAVMLFAASSVTFAKPNAAAKPDDAKTNAAADKKTSKAQNQKATDPVCGMSVDTKTAEKAKYQGKTYYFCSREERLEFEKNPSKYAKK